MEVFPAKFYYKGEGLASGEPAQARVKINNGGQPSNGGRI